MSQYLIDNAQILESPEEILSTMDKDGHRRWLYPTSSNGKYYRRRLIVGWALIFFFVALPIIRINGHPAVLLNFMASEFSLFGLVFYPTDTLLLMLLGIGSILSVILGTALLGRIWCGWGCPQTVYLEFVYRPIERWIEGKEHVRKKRDAQGLTLDKFWRKGLKFIIYTIISFALANVFVSYIVGWDSLIQWMSHSPFDHMGFFWLMFITTGLMLFDFGYFREQMCIITCPYARMQSVLLDKDSLIVSYDPKRGEPRGHLKKAKQSEDSMIPLPVVGDCIDCFACVRTCPTGIDIRNGLQMECIACTQCVDACDDIMDKVGKDRGLIRYTSENALDGKPAKILRPRVIIYATLIVAIWGFLGASILMRSDYQVNITRHPSAPYIQLSPTELMNRVRIRVRNQTGKPTNVNVEVNNPKGIRVQVIGAPTISLQPAEMKHFEAFVVIPSSAFNHKDQLDATFHFKFSDGSAVDKHFTLLGLSVQ
jgi:cytochrome c oxidase accessory protein FixG